MDSVNVAVRLRPLLSREPSDAAGNWKVSGRSISCTRGPSVSYTFDHVFDKDSTNAEVFEAISRPIVQSTLAGFHGTIFAYGQTSSGKTHTMMGSPREPGVIQLALDEIFSIIAEKANRMFLIRVSFLEIYNECITDLLQPGSTNLKIHENAQREVYVGDVKEVNVTSIDEVLSLLKFGEKNRTIGRTDMNEHSSRSHTIFRMTIESREGDDEEGQNEEAIRVATLNLVDLAGSERAGATGAEGVRLKEGGFINRSLFVLSNVINKIADGDHTHIPFRDSKLTRILQTSLGGNARTAILCAATPASIDETLGTLKFATRAKTIKNKPVVNEVMTEAAQLKRRDRELLELRRQLAMLTQERETRDTNHVEQIKKLEALIIPQKPAFLRRKSRKKDEKSRRHTLCPEFLAKRSFASDDDDESEVDDTFGLEARGSCDDISRDERFSQSLVRSRIQPPGRRGSRVAKLPSRLDALDMPSSPLPTVTTRRRESRRPSRKEELDFENEIATDSTFGVVPATAAVDDEWKVKYAEVQQALVQQEVDNQVLKDKISTLETELSAQAQQSVQQPNQENELSAQAQQSVQQPNQENEMDVESQPPAHEAPKQDDSFVEAEKWAGKIEDLENENDELHRKLHDLEAFGRNLVSSLEDRLKTETAEKDSMNAQLEALQQEILVLRDGQQEASTLDKGAAPSVEDVSQDVAAAQAALSVLQAEMLQLQVNHRQEMEIKDQEVATAKDAYEEEVRRVKAEYTSAAVPVVESTNVAASEEIWNQRLQAVEQELAAAREECATELQRNVEAAEIQLKLREEIQTLTEAHYLRDESFLVKGEQKMAETTQSLGEVEAELRQKNNVVERLQAESGALRQENGELRANLEELQVAIKEMAEAKSNDNNEDTAQLLAEEISQLKESHQSALDQAEQAAKLQQSLGEELASKEKELDAVKLAFDEELSKRDSEVSVLHRSHEEALSHLQQEINELRETSSKEEEISQLKESHQSALDQAEQAAQLQQSLKEELASREEELACIQESHQQSVTMAQQAAQLQQSLREELASKEEELAHSQESHQESVAMAQKELDAVKEAFDKEVSKRDSEVSDLRSSHEEALSHLQQEINELRESSSKEEEISQLKESHQSALDQAEQATKLQQSLREELTSKEKELAHVQESHQESIIMAQQELDAAKEGFDEELSKRDSEVSDLRTSHKEALSHLQQEINELRESSSKEEDMLQMDQVRREELAAKEEELARVRESYQQDLILVQQELASAKDAYEDELRKLKLEVVAVQQARDEEQGGDRDQQESSSELCEQLQGELRAKEEELSRVQDQHKEALSSMHLEFSQAKEAYEDEISKLKMISATPVIGDSTDGDAMHLLEEKWSQRLAAATEEMSGMEVRHQEAMAAVQQELSHVEEIHEERYRDAITLIQQEVAQLEASHQKQLHLKDQEMIDLKDAHQLDLEEVKLMHSQEGRTEDNADSGDAVRTLEEKWSQRLAAASEESVRLQESQQEALAALQQEVEALTTKLSQECASKEQELARLHEQHQKALTQAQQDATESEQQLSAEITGLAEELSKLQEARSEDLTAQEQEIATLKDVHQEMVCSLQQEIALMKDSYKDTATQVEQDFSQLQQSLKADLAAKEEEITSLRESLVEEHERSVAQVRQEATMTENQLNDEIKALIEENSLIRSRHTEEMSQARQELSKLQEVRSEELSVQEQESSRQQESHRENLIALQKEVQDLQTSLNEERASWEQDITQLQETHQKDIVQAQQDAVTNERQLTDRCSALTEEITRLQEGHEQMMEQVKQEVSQFHGSLKEELASKDEEIARLQEHQLEDQKAIELVRQEAARTASQLEDEVKALMGEVSSIRARHTEELSHAQEELSKLEIARKEDLAAHEQEIASIKDSYKEVISSHEQRVTDSEHQLRVENNMLSEELAVAKEFYGAEVSKLQSDVASQQDATRTATAALQSVEDQWSQRLNSAVEEIDSLQKRHHQETAELHQEVSQIQLRHQADIEQRDQELAAVKVALEEERSQQPTTNPEDSNAVHALRLQLADLEEKSEKEITWLKKLIDDADSEGQDWMWKYHELAKEQKRLAPTEDTLRKLSDTQEENKALQQHVAALKEQLSAQPTNSDSSSKDVAELKRQVTQSQSEIERLQRIIDEVDGELSQVVERNGQQLKERDNAMNEMRAQLERAVTEHKNSQVRCEGLTTELEDLRNQKLTAVASPRSSPRVATLRARLNELEQSNLRLQKENSVLRRNAAQIGKEEGAPKFAGLGLDSKSIVTEAGAFTLKIHANQVEAENKRLVAENKRLRLQARESKVKASGLEDTVAMGESNSSSNSQTTTTAASALETEPRAASLSPPEKKRFTRSALRATDQSSGGLEPPRLNREARQPTRSFAESSSASSAGMLPASQQNRPFSASGNATALSSQAATEPVRPTRSSAAPASAIAVRSATGGSPQRDETHMSSVRRSPRLAEPAPTAREAMSAPSYEDDNTKENKPLKDALSKSGGKSGNDKDKKTERRKSVRFTEPAANASGDIPRPSILEPNRRRSLRTRLENWKDDTIVQDETPQCQQQ